MYQSLTLPSRAAKCLLPVLVLFVSGSLFFSCKKGDTGPAGQTGPVGSANVIYSAWVNSGSVRDTTIDNSALSVAYVTAPRLVDSIVQKGTILLYFTYGGGNFTLPYTSNAGGKVSTISYIPRVGNFVITRFTHDNSNSVKLSSTLQYRYILIPGGVPTGRMAVADYKNMTYEQVCDYLQIPL